ncbi:hypothetical protein C8R43DRAFT_594394 [Mycena crocata]|nr:hypothetical protein C8R43DRAFT_594394 [Mycena crocata]
MMLASGPSSLRPLPRRHSLTPLTQHTLPSASEFNHVRRSSESASPPSRALDRRHSVSLMRKPLRSSPLAGPALSSEGTSDDDTPVSRPGPMSSAPNLHSVSRPPSPPPPPVPSLPPTPKRLSKRASLIELVKRPLASKTPPPPLPLPSPPTNTGSTGPSIIHTLPPAPPLSPHRRARSRSRGSISASISMTDLSASFPLPPPTFPRALTAPSTSRRTSTHPLPTTKAATSVYGSAATNESGDNWLTSTSYGTTPRFSRLDLAAPNVVLPVSARESRRRSIRGEGGKRVSLVYAPPITPPRRSSLIYPNPGFSSSTPSLFTRSRSSVSSEGPTTPSAFSSVFGTGSVVLSDDDEYASTHEDGVDLSLVSPHDFEVASQDASSDAHGDIALKPTLTPARSTWSLSVGRHRRSYVKGTSFLSFGSGDSTSTSTFSPMQSPVQSPTHSPSPSYSPSPSRVEARKPTARSYLSAYDGVSETFDPDAEMANPQKDASKSPSTAKVAGTMRRLFRSLSGVARRTP